MKSYLKYILIGIGTVVLEWIFVALVSSFFSGLSQEGSVVIGTGFFLAFEMVICTGAIISKINRSTAHEGDSKL